MNVSRCRNGHAWDSPDDAPCPACGAAAEPATTALLVAAPRPADDITLSVAAPPGDLTRTSDGAAGDPAPDAPRPDLPGYELLADLGDGGMGRVYKARQVHLDREVAVKVIRPDRVASPSAVRRFRREARAVAKLDHPNIVRVHDANEANGTHFLVMEYLPGTDLGKLVERRGPLPVAEACEYARQACLGLEHARERGLVHRDIKPANLMLCNGVVKVLDLGLARLNDPAAPTPLGEHEPDRPAAAAADTLSMAGGLVGTPDFLAPEQAADLHAADTRADLYSLGCTLFVLLTGRVVFPGGDVAGKVERHAREAPPAVTSLRPDVPPKLAAVVAKLLAKNPADRYPTPAEAAAALEPFARPTVRR
ncbi:MAG: serine/threonine protein kinase, partial [Gemmataceae bacterium]|nr:serine/threonine protein kinase [Gemmataceae bacterium]